MYWFHTGRGFCLSGAEASGPPDIISRRIRTGTAGIRPDELRGARWSEFDLRCAEEAKTPQCAHNHSRNGESHVDRSETLRGPPSAAEIADESRCLRWTHTNHRICASEGGKVTLDLLDAMFELLDLAGQQRTGRCGQLLWRLSKIVSNPCSGDPRAEGTAMPNSRSTPRNVLR
jgi:hypothetical protein